MWVLENENTGNIFPMVSNTRYKIGRLMSDLQLQNDKSISGTHAYISVNRNESGSEWLDLEDAGSRNGTFVNEGIKNKTPLRKNSSVKLYEGDVVLFGVIENNWRIRRMKFCTASSGLTIDEIENLETLLMECGGKHIDSVNENCSHLTMNEIKVTCKVIKALLSDIPIVNLEYWQDLVNVSLKKKGGPVFSIEKYKPKLTDILLSRQISDFGYRKERKSVFVGKTFVFLSQKHFEMYESIVSGAGGSSKKLNKVQKAFLLRKDVIVVQYLPSSDLQKSQGTETINIITEYLRTNSRRLIPDYEIALAIIECSTTVYCNPDYKITSSLIPTDSPMVEPESIYFEKIAIPRHSEIFDFFVPETECQQQQSLDDRNLQSSQDREASQSIFTKNKRTIHEVLLTDKELGKNENDCAKKSQLDGPSSNPRKKICNNFHVDMSNFQFPLNMDDDEDDDLFNFDGNEKLSSIPEKQICNISSKEMSENNSISSSKKIPSNNIVRERSESVSSIPVQQTPVAPSFSETALSVGKNLLPLKINTKYWKMCSDKENSKSFSIYKTKCQAEAETNHDSCSEPIQGGFKISSISTITLHNCQNLSQSGNTSSLNKSSNSYKPNFKKFRKQKYMRRG